jgi:plasmanylethanolamine desaturase
MRLQRAYVLQTPRHHGRHHQGEKNSHYCVVTNFLNPLLEEVGFWRRLETGVEKLTGRKPRHAPQ